MKSLFWKEWRESRVNLLFGVVFFIGISLVSLFYYATHTVREGFLPTQEIEMLLVFIFAGYFGAHSFSKEKGAFEFLLSVPVERKVIFLEKWLTGILSIFIILIVAIVVEGIFYKTNNFGLLSSNFKAHDFIFWGPQSLIATRSLGYSSSDIFLYYNVTFLLSILFTETYIALLAGAILAVLVGGIAYWVLVLSGSLFYHFSLNETWLSSSKLMPIALLIISLIILFISYRIFSRKEVGT